MEKFIDFQGFFSKSNLTKHSFSLKTLSLSKKINTLLLKLKTQRREEKVVFAGWHRRISSSRSVWVHSETVSKTKVLPDTASLNPHMCIHTCLILFS
jgi:hypothetical protein